MTGADPWWNSDTGVIDLDEPVVDERRRATNGTASAATRTKREGIAPRLLHLLLLPFIILGTLIGRSPVMRRFGVRLVIVTCILAVVGGAVGVILLNNVVIGRTAELGELDDRRRELRRENALLNAKRSRLAASDKVVKKATKQLGMTDSGDMPRYVFLVPGSRPLTPYMRARVAAAQRKRQEALEAQRAAASASTKAEPTKKAAE